MHRSRGKNGSPAHGSAGCAFVQVVRPSNSILMNTVITSGLPVDALSRARLGEVGLTGIGLIPT